MVTLTVYAVDGETDKALGAFDYNGQTVNASVVVLPVGTPLPTLAQAAAACKAIAANNPPLAVNGPADVQMVGSPGLAASGLVLAGQARIYRVPAGGVDIVLGALNGVQGWYVGVLPQSTAVYEFAPAVSFYTTNDVLGIYAYRKDLSAVAKEVIAYRAIIKKQLAQMCPQWGGTLIGNTVADCPQFIMDLVLHYLLNTVPPQDPRLQAYWGDGWALWAIADFAIPARDFAAMLDRYARMQAIIEEVPWPDLPYFKRCAMGTVITLDKAGRPLVLGNWRLYSSTFTSYWAGRSDVQIRRDLGALWLGNLGDIVRCIIEKVAEKEKDLKRAGKFWFIAHLAMAALSFGTPLIPAQIVAGAIGDPKGAYEFFKAIFYDNSKPLYQNLINIVTLAVDVATGGTVPLELVLKAAVQYAKQAAAQMVAPKLADLLNAAAQLAALGKDTQAAALLAGAGGIAQGIADDPALAQALLDLVASGGTFAQFVQKALGLDNIPPVLLPFIIWCISVSGFGMVLQQAFELAKTVAALLGQLWDIPPVNPQTDVTYPLIGAANAAGVVVPPGTLALAQGANPDYPQQLVAAKPKSPVAAAVAGAGFATFLGYLIIAGKLF